MTETYMYCRSCGRRGCACGEENWVEGVEGEDQLDPLEPTSLETLGAAQAVMDYIRPDLKKWQGHPLVKRVAEIIHNKIKQDDWQKLLDAAEIAQDHLIHNADSTCSDGDGTCPRCMLSAAVAKLKEE